MGADPSPSSGPPGQTKPDKSPNPNKPDKAAKAEKAAEVPVTVQGTVTKGTDENGRPTYSLTADGKTWQLSAGPSWYWGDKNPLNAYVGKSVSIAGSTQRECPASLTERSSPRIPEGPESATLARGDVVSTASTRTA